MPCILSLLLGRACALGPENRGSSQALSRPPGACCPGRSGVLLQTRTKIGPAGPPGQEDVLVFTPGLGISFVFSETDKSARGVSASGRQREFSSGTSLGGKPAGPRARSPPACSALPALGHPAPERLTNLLEVTQRAAVWWCRCPDLWLPRAHGLPRGHDGGQA